jgi:hypothetical protein
VLENEIGMAAQSATCALNLNWTCRGVMEEPVEQCGCGDRIAKYLAGIGRLFLR